MKRFSFCSSSRFSQSDLYSLQTDASEASALTSDFQSKAQQHSARRSPLYSCGGGLRAKTKSRVPSGGCARSHRNLLNVRLRFLRRRERIGPDFYSISASPCPVDDSRLPDSLLLILLLSGSSVVLSPFRLLVSNSSLFTSRQLGSPRKVATCPQAAC